MATIHIDETGGSDTTGNGAQDQPYQSLGFAVFTHGATTSLLTRKDATRTYEEPTLSSLKKAKKTAEGIEKKKKKQEELAEREAKEHGEAKEKREKLLEESKKIKLEEDPTLPQAVKVCISFITAVAIGSDDDLVVENPSSRKPPVEASSRIWMGASVTGPQGTRLSDFTGWYRLSPSCSLRCRGKEEPSYF